MTQTSKVMHVSPNEIEILKTSNVSD